MADERPECTEQAPSADRGEFEQMLAEIPEYAFHYKREDRDPRPKSPAPAVSTAQRNTDRARNVKRHVAQAVARTKKRRAFRKLLRGLTVH